MLLPFKGLDGVPAIKEGIENFKIGTGRWRKRKKRKNNIEKEKGKGKEYKEKKIDRKRNIQTE